MRYAVATAKSPPAIGSPHGGYTLSTCSAWSVPSDRTTAAATPAATAPLLRQKDVVIWLPSKLQRAARRAGRRGCRQGPAGRLRINYFSAGASGPRDRGGPMRRASIRKKSVTQVFPPSVERSPLQEKRSGRLP